MSKGKRLVAIIIVIALGITSFTIVSKWASDPESYAKCYEQINTVEGNARNLSLAAVGAATLAAAIPGEAATPVANKLMDIAGYTVIIFVFIILEKYLLILSGSLLFKILIPVAAVILVIALLMKDDDRRNAINSLASKIVIAGLLLWALVPISLGITSAINTSYEKTADMSGETAIEEEYIKSDAAETAAAEDVSGEGSLWDKAKSKVKTATDKTKAALVDFKDNSSKKLKDYKNDINRFIERIAILIVTTCVIPICVLLLGIWIIKIIFGLNIQVRLPQASKIIKKKSGEEVTET